MDQGGSRGYGDRKDDKDDEEFLRELEFKKKELEFKKKSIIAQINLSKEAQPVNDPELPKKLKEETEEFAKLKVEKDAEITKLKAENAEITKLKGEKDAEITKLKAKLTKQEKLEVAQKEENTKL